MSDSERLSVGGVGLEVQRWGSGAGRTPILMLHEGLGSVALWRDFPAQLAARTGRETIAWSRRGHGWSDALAAPHEPDYMHREAAGLPALMDALGIERAHLLGHSDGASIALIAAASCPDRIASLILEAPHLFVEELTVTSIAGIGTNFEANDLARRMARYHRDPESIFRAWNHIWLDPRFRDWNIQASLADARAPTLLIQGRDDEYGSVAQLEPIEAALPAQRLMLGDCGHSPHRDQPRAVLDAIVAFLEAVDPPGG